jgi:chitodextrinase
MAHIKTYWQRRIATVALLVLGTFSGYLVVHADTEEYSDAKAYAQPGTRVVYNEAATGGGFKVGIFENGWYLAAGQKPKFYPNGDGWKQIGATVIVTDLNADTGALETTPDWVSTGVYVGGNIAKKNGSCYKALWWTQGNDPASGSPWESVACPSSTAVANPWKDRTSAPPVTVSDSTLTTSLTTTTKETIKTVLNTNTAPTADNPAWLASSVYLTGSVVQNASKCFKAKWWTQGNEPKLAAQLANAWDSPWEELTGCPTGNNASGLPANMNTSGTTGTVSAEAATKAAAQAPQPVMTTNTTDTAATAAAAKQTANTLTAAIPPVVPAAVPKSTAVSTAAPTALPSDGYAFLRLLTNDDWNWMFPLRSGKYATNGGSRNAAPIAASDGSTDSFSLNAFIRAVLEYNNWAKTNGYKQFLNQGTLKQQAEEFLVFWAKSSRETSGSWSTAPSPWIETETFAGETMKVWKGGLYWVEEVGYTTNSATGKSTAIGYVDTGSSMFPPSAGRSYYGRGVIQLSWNYNYGAFSYWMYDNGLFRTAKDAAGVCKVDARDKLLDYPNLVADCGDLSILSGIWFWMTPQGAKPSSHDVIYGDVTNISKSTQDNGLPKTNTSYVPKTAAGETSDSEVFAYRLGTVINIVNGGLECNKASTWHGGPLQRVSYYNAYAAKFNEKYKVNATRVNAATNVWTDKVSDSSSVELQSATCYNQKSYYGW